MQTKLSNKGPDCKLVNHGDNGRAVEAMIAFGRPSDIG